MAVSAYDNYKEPKWSKELLSLSTMTCTVKYEPSQVDWPKILTKRGTITVNGVSVPVAITDVKYENGYVSADLVFTPEDYAEFKKAWEGTECQNKNLKLS